MNGETSATLNFYGAGELETDAWCNRCALPSAIRQRFIIDTDSPSRYYPQVVTLTACPDCGSSTA